MPGAFQNGNEILCDSCRKRLRLPLEKYVGKSLRITCPSCGTILRRQIEQPVGKRVLIAHEEPPVCQRLQKQLASVFQQTQTAVTAEQVLQTVRTEKVDLLVLDVGLPGMLFLELIDRLQADAAIQPRKILLISSTYRPGAYRNQPQSLYGADGWLDLEALDDLPTIVKQLFADDPVHDDQTTVEKTPVEKSEDLKQVLLQAVEPLVQGGSTEPRRLAQQIVGQIIERHRPCLAQPWADLRAVQHLLDDLDIGRHVLAQVSAASRSADRDFLHEAFVTTVSLERPPVSSSFDGAYRSPDQTPVER